jgi:hypothetical protein
MKPFRQHRLWLVHRRFGGRVSSSLITDSSDAPEQPIYGER